MFDVFNLFAQEDCDMLNCNHAWSIKFLCKVKQVQKNLV